MATEKTLRGYWAIKEVLEKMGPYVAWLKQNRPECKSVTLRRTDYDLIVRWPKASELHKITVADGVATFEGLTLRYDSRPGRYGESRYYTPPKSPANQGVNSDGL